MPKKFSGREKKKWLELYEGGKSEEWIAENEALCDKRTVRKGIQEARRELEAHALRMELLKDAVRKHQESLLALVREVLSALAMPEDTLNIPWKWQGITTIQLEAARAEVRNDEALTVSVTLSAENKPEWELLQEHLRRDPVWNALAQWKKAVGAEIGARINLKRKAIHLIKKKMEYEFVDHVTNPPEVYFEPLITLLCQPTINRILGIRDGTNFKEGIVVDIVHGEVIHRGSIIARVPGTEEKCKAEIIDAIEELETSTETTDVAKAHKAVEEWTQKARRSVEELSLLGLVPGQCRVCKRLGM